MTLVALLGKKQGISKRYKMTMVPIIIKNSTIGTKLSDICSKYFSKKSNHQKTLPGFNY